ncbi:hypothetical protein QR680_016996 [Steinernema hermaphroditum]|uniref:Uncharacterized protein n=1 Tax=Steinernema hermaphroditum TaxID=289476 RepID=A0AA39LNJ4_9BILA|nr:hypothetical protein QR680_016996 [Steinernema hermaphroditum]
MQQDADEWIPKNKGHDYDEEARKM